MTNTFKMNRCFQITVWVSLFLLLLRSDSYGQSLIPARSQYALEKWGLLSPFLDQPATPAALSLDQNSKYPIYLFSDNVASFEFNACSDEATLSLLQLPQLMSATQIKAALGKWLDEPQVVKIAEGVKQKLLPTGVVFRVDMTEEFGHVSVQENGKSSQKVPNANIAKVFFKEKKASVFGLSTLLVAVEKSTGKIQAVGLSVVNEQQCESPQQTKDLQPDVESVETWDEWLLCHQVPLTKDRSSTIEDNQGFPSVESNVRVYLNSELCGNGLIFPPRVENLTPLIYQGYFPKFLIATKREGDTITLRGQLPGKGHEAVVKLGSKDATIDGKPFTLSGAPQEIDGRLYLPYELLHQCNGVLVRWDEKKNTLWVDTRYLRRP